ncbi:hypothetical protein A6A04_16075 [Paramagnetospirillum marisnigri]|uniref:Uncharacterized protein n=1 Tax=Paramagnetospirillum marisnigri TaxID=1285242 RepID=A0A178MT40_9PROT|nr:hypothetical protein [Paramagnetospirillum marisnigri]OAN51434.1 hypothetical protein A6A04_16075 [Paramagnetospirillum marisnigri]
MATEVYSCRDGQELKQGKLDYCDIEDRGEAEDDAKRRCKLDPSIKKVAYYKVAPDGEFRMFYSYTNPNCKPAPKPQIAAGPTLKKKPPAKKPAPKPGLLARLKKKIGL